MVKKLELDYNEKGEITSPSYIEIVAKVNEYESGFSKLFKKTFLISSGDGFIIT